MSGLPAGYGGALGLAGAYGVDAAVRLVGNPSVEGPLRLALLALFAIGGFVIGWFALGCVPRRSNGRPTSCGATSSAAPRPRRSREALGDDEDGAAAPPRSRPAVAVAEPPRPIAAGRQGRTEARQGASRARQPRAGRRLSAACRSTCSPPPPEKPKGHIDRAGLERNARLLESVLEDFHVRGDIVEVRPGPVVTMYELEPASGIKASRVIQLADDIARNMSALSARVATIPGRSVIGIELPNQKRETVSLVAS